MKLRFIEQTIIDFKSFEGEHALVWDYPGVTFVKGTNHKAERLASNGSGKSSLWDALCWCLFGRTPGGLKNPDVLPWSESGNPDVIELIEMDGVQHAIRRTASPNHLYIDGIEASQERVEELVGTFDLFVNTQLLAQGRKLFFDLPPKDKMELFSDTLQLDRWDARVKAASNAVDVAERAVLTIQSTQRGIEQTTKQLEELVVEAKTKAEAWLIEQRAKSRDATKKLAGLQEKLEAKDKQLSSAILKQDGAETEAVAIRREVTKLTTELTVIMGAKEQARAVREALQEQRAELAKELRELSKAKSCPTCGQPVKATNLAEHKEHLEDKIAQADKALASGVPAKLTDAEKAVGDKLDLEERQLQEFQDKADAAESEVRRLTPEVATLKAQIVELKRVSETEEANPHTAQIAALRVRLKGLATQGTELEGELIEATRRIERNRFWVKGFKDIKLQLIEDVLDELELATNSMLEEVGLVGWEIRYDIERETKSGTLQRALSVAINSPESKGFVKWESYSGGERQRLRIVGALALADVLLNHSGLETNLEILDEPTTHLSKTGADELVDMLVARAQSTGKSIFYCDHLAQASSKFASVVTIIKDNDGSYIAKEV